MQELVKQGNTQKSTNNPMSGFGLIEENVELSPIHLAVKPFCSRNFTHTVMFFPQAIF